MCMINCFWMHVIPQIWNIWIGWISYWLWSSTGLTEKVGKMYNMFYLLLSAVSLFNKIVIEIKEKTSPDLAKLWIHYSPWLVLIGSNVDIQCYPTQNHFVLTLSGSFPCLNQFWSYSSIKIHSFWNSFQLLSQHICVSFILSPYQR